MRFKDAKAVGEGLKAWRTERLKETRKDILERGRGLRKLDFKDEQPILRYENGIAFPSVDTLIDGLFPAYEIRDLDRFLLGYCMPRLEGLSEVRHLRVGEEIHREKKYGGTTRYGVSDAAFLGRVPVRIDRFVIPKGERSETIRHSGYNYLLVTRGRVCCHLEESTRATSKSKTAHYDLGEGESLLFPTTLWHWIEATGDEKEAEFIVAAPGWAHDDVVRKNEN